MNNQEIINDAPKGSTVVFNKNAITACGVPAVTELLVVLKPRSLADIKRIVELEAYLKKVQADRINDIAIERKRWARADLVALEILRLEQQAKGLIDYAETRYKNVKRGQYHHIMMSAGRLQIEAEALKEPTL